MNKNELLQKVIYYQRSKNLHNSIGIMTLIIITTVSLNVFFVNNLSSILNNIKRLDPAIVEINKQVNLIENHVNKKNNVICEVQKKDLKTVNRNGKTMSLVSYNYNKGYEKLKNILEQNTSLKGINFE